MSFSFSLTRYLEMFLGMWWASRYSTISNQLHFVFHFHYNFSDLFLIHFCSTYLLCFQILVALLFSGSTSWVVLLSPFCFGIFSIITSCVYTKQKQAFRERCSFPPELTPVPSYIRILTRRGSNMGVVPSLKIGNTTLP